MAQSVNQSGDRSDDDQPRSHAFKKILLVRPDRIGDVILTTPAYAAIRAYYPDAQIYFLVRKEISVLLEGLPGVAGTLAYDPDGEHAGRAGMKRLASEIRSLGADLAVMFQNTPRVSIAVWLAAVPVRVGPLSKLSSLIFFNRRVRQNRSEVRMHEADYNIDLLERTGIVPQVRVRPHCEVFLSDVVRQKAKKILEAKGIAAGTENLVIVHPGMRGSAPNWPVFFYLELIERLARAKRTVLVTFGPTEGDLHAFFAEEIAKWNLPVRTFSPLEATDLSLMAGIISFSAVVVAPSTGPMHLAVALEKPVVSFFPPPTGETLVQSAHRWGPYVQNASEASVFVATSVEQGELAGVAVDLVYRKVEAWL